MAIFGLKPYLLVSKLYFFVQKKMVGLAFLSVEQKEQFLRDGILVVDEILSQSEVEEAKKGLEETLKRNGVNNESLLTGTPEDEDSARALQQLSTTNGSGGVLDIFYEDWKLDICQNENLFRITTELWEAAYACSEGEEERSSCCWWQQHPYGSFDCKKGYIYIDRICYRLPTKIAEKLGDKINSDKKKRLRKIQRSLTPHLDCCPDKLFQNAAKWRPIQCFVSLTDNLEANTGGFEAAKGFHRDFPDWVKNRRPTIVVQKNKGGSSTKSAISPPCVGEYTHIRPKEDRDVMERVCHIPIHAGSAVFWDNRIPHSNAYKHMGTSPRCVVYCSFLPDVELNRSYVTNQCIKFKTKKPVTDQWNQPKTENEMCEGSGQNKKQHYTFTSLGRKLMGIDPWV